MPDEQLIAQLACRARAHGLSLAGEGGLLTKLTKIVIESALESEMNDYLGYGKHDPAGRDGGNSRNSHRPHQGIANARPLYALPVPIADPEQIARLDIQRSDRLGGILHEYEHAA